MLSVGGREYVTHYSARVVRMLIERKVIERTMWLIRRSGGQSPTEVLSRCGPDPDGRCGGALRSGKP